MNIQSVQEFWENSPCNIKHSNKEVGSKDFFNEVEKKRRYVEPHNFDFANYEKWKGKKVLEIGCGIGADAINFAKAGADYTGVDLSKKSLDITKKRFECEHENGTFYCLNAEELSKIIPIETYDLVYSFGVIHHTPHPQKILKEIKKYMNKTSTLKIMLYAKESWKNYMIEAGLDQSEAQDGCPIANTYTKDDVKKLLSLYKILSIEQKHIFPYQIKSYKKGQCKLEPWFESMPKEVFRTLEKHLGWHLLITAKLK